MRKTMQRRELKNNENRAFQVFFYLGLYYIQMYYNLSQWLGSSIPLTPFHF